MLLEEILPKLRKGGWAKREAWSGIKAIKIQFPDEHSKMTLPYVYYNDGKGEVIPFVFKQRDILGDDWYMVEGFDHV